MKDLLATYYFRPKEGVDASYAANALREEQTTGTWTDLSTVNEKTAYVHALDGSVEELLALPDGGYLTRICFPHEIFEKGNIPQYLSVIAGNLFGLGKLDAVRLVDIDLPENRGVYRFTAPLLDHVECDTRKRCVSGTSAMTADFYEYHLPDAVFDPLREREDFRKLLEREG